jgi:hypothetical protein
MVIRSEAKCSGAAAVTDRRDNSILSPNTSPTIRANDYPRLALQSLPQFQRSNRVHPAIFVGGLKTERGGFPIWHAGFT